MDRSIKTRSRSQVGSGECRCFAALSSPAIATESKKICWSKYMAPNVFGQIRLGDYDAGPDLSKVRVDVELRHSGFPLETYPAHVESNGGYQLDPERPGSGSNLGTKPSRWLRDTVTGVSLSATGVTIRQTRHTNGDIDGDNEVGTGDYAILSGAYGTSEEDPGFAAGADLNGDGAVDIGDYSILMIRIYSITVTLTRYNSTHCAV